MRSDRSPERLGHGAEEQRQIEVDAVFEVQTALARRARLVPPSASSRTDDMEKKARQVGKRQDLT
jgi:hypothetical protein